MDRKIDKRIGSTSIIRAFHHTELHNRITDKQRSGYELVDQGYESKRLDGSRWWAKLRYVGCEDDPEAGAVNRRTYATTWFAQQMNEKLQENLHKGGWERCDHTSSIGGERMMEGDVYVHFTEKRCPQCNSKLLKDDTTGWVWCSLVGCDYGIGESVLDGDS